MTKNENSSLAQQKILREINFYYSSKIKKYGPVPLGVDWNDKDSQFLRFDQLMKIIPTDAKNFSILDFGCGYGALLEYLREKKIKTNYLGYDISERMIKVAQKKFPKSDGQFTTTLKTSDRVDFVLASGIFNVCQTRDYYQWTNYVLNTINLLYNKCLIGVSLNFLTNYSDAGKTKTGLYYAHPEFIFSYCKQNLSKKVALLHDYNLFEFTILIRK